MYIFKSLTIIEMVPEWSEMKKQFQNKLMQATELKNSTSGGNYIPPILIWNYNINALQNERRQDFKL